MDKQAEVTSIKASSHQLLLLPLALSVLLPWSLADTFASEGLSLVNIAIAIAFFTLVPYLAWSLSLEVTVNQSIFKARRVLGHASSIEIPLHSISEFRAKSDSSGRLTRFEVIVEGKRVVQLHIFQKNFLTAVTAFRNYCPDVPEHILSGWAL